MTGEMDSLNRAFVVVSQLFDCDFPSQVTYSFKRSR